jgi:hypothetical protein
LIASLSSPPPKGTVIGIDRLGGTGDSILPRTLKKLGIDPDLTWRFAKSVSRRSGWRLFRRVRSMSRRSAYTITVEDKLAAEKFGLNILVDISKLGVEVLSSGHRHEQIIYQKKKRMRFAGS